MTKKQKKNNYLLEDDQDESHILFGKSSDKKTFISLLKYSKPFRLQISLALFLILLSSISAIISSKLMGDLLEKGLIARDFNHSLLFSSLIISRAGLWRKLNMKPCKNQC